MNNELRAKIDGIFGKVKILNVSGHFPQWESTSIDEAKDAVYQLVVESQIQILEAMKDHRSFLDWGDGVPSELDDYLEKRKGEPQSQLSSIGGK